MANTGEAKAPGAVAGKPQGRGRLGLVALALTPVVAAAAFFGAREGYLPLPADLWGLAPVAAAESGGDGAEAMPRGGAGLEGGLPRFIAVEPFVISLGPQIEAEHLRLTVAIEADPEMAEDVEALIPRIRDVLNTFLRAVDARVFEDPYAMLRLRAQMLRRVQLVSPQGAVRDLLIQDFVLN